MTRDEVIALAREAQQDHEVRWSEADVQTVAFFLSFAALVAAKEREACAAQCQHRADVCEEHSERIRKAQGYTQAWEWVRATARAAGRCAAAIRARGQKDGA